MFVPVAVALACGVVGYAYYSMRPPRPKICGAPGGPPVTSPRFKLSDGRHLSYREWGVPKEEAKYKIIVVHGFNSSRNLELPISEGLIQELKIYFLSYDRAGYGESDAYSSRTLKSDAYDIQELADALQIGSKFYVIGMSLGAYVIYGCLKYIPHRLLGASMVVPLTNFWWQHLPVNLLKEGFNSLPSRDQWVLRVAHHAPWLFYWWMTQKWFPTLSAMTGNTAIFSRQDLELVKKWSENPDFDQDKVCPQGVHESLHRDILVAYGDWDFSPTELINPIPDSEGSVHIWQGYEDRFVPYKINKYIGEKVPGIQYHEVPDGGHFLIFNGKNFEDIVRALLLG